MKPKIFVLGLIAVWLIGFDSADAQSVRSLVNEGNDLYEEEKFNDAEVNYRKAIEEDPELVEGHFNLGNTLYKQEEYEDAVKEYEYGVIRSEEKKTKAQAHYNIGNSHFRAQKYQDAIKSYIEALKLDPNDSDAKYNLSYALGKLREQQKQQNKGENNQNQERDKQKESQDKNSGQKQGQDKQAEQQKEQEQQTQQQKEEQRQEREQQARPEKLMSKADAERILDVLKNSEREVQKKLRAQQQVRTKTDKDW